MTSPAPRIGRAPSDGSRCARSAISAGVTQPKYIACECAWRTFPRSSPNAAPCATAKRKNAPVSPARTKKASAPRHTQRNARRSAVRASSGIGRGEAVRDGGQRLGVGEALGGGERLALLEADVRGERVGEAREGVGRRVHPAHEPLDLVVLAGHLRGEVRRA